MQKRQSIERLVIEQAGLNRLILNDLILNHNDIQLICQLIPQYHSHIEHIQIKGNNIDGFGFSLIFTALEFCCDLRSIMAQWNFIGSGPQGLVSLGHLARKCTNFELIDLSNNKISNEGVQLICRLITMNIPTLRVINLRWNDISDLGARAIWESLRKNSYLKYIGLEDNRISMEIVMEIESLLRTEVRGGQRQFQQLNRQNRSLQALGSHFHLSQQAYPSMEVQLKTGQLRTKIQNDHRQSEIYNQKLQGEIQKVLQRISMKGRQIHEMSLKMDTLCNENSSLTHQLIQAQRMLTLEKERQFGSEKALNGEKSKMRSEKYLINQNIKTMMEKYSTRNQSQLSQLDAIMALKHEKLQAFFKDRLGQKRRNYQKLTDIKEDLIRFKMSKELVWDKVTASTLTAGGKSRFQDECMTMEEMIAKADSFSKNQSKKGKYMAEELSSLVVKGLQNEQKLQTHMFEVKQKIKSLHSQMAKANIEIQGHYSKLKLLENECQQNQLGVQLRRRYIKYIQSQNSINCEIESLKMVQRAKAEKLRDQSLDIRISDLEATLRSQLTQNKMLKNQYQKLINVVQNAAKSTIQHILFQS